MTVSKQDNDFELELKRQIGELPLEITAKKPLWPGIEKAIELNELAEEHTPSHAINIRDWLPVATAALVVIAISFLFVNNFYPSTINQPDSLVNELSQPFETQKAALLVRYQGQKALTNNWQLQLNELEQAEQAIKQVLTAQPANAALLGMLAQVYRQQLDLINKVHQPQWQQI